MEMDSWNSARLREDFEEQARMKRMSSRIRQRIGVSSLRVPLLLRFCPVSCRSLWVKVKPRLGLSCWRSWMTGLTLHAGGLQHVSFFQKLVHTHAVCLCLSRVKNEE